MKHLSRVQLNAIFVEIVLSNPIADEFVLFLSPFQLERIAFIHFLLAVHLDPTEHCGPLD